MSSVEKKIFKKGSTTHYFSAGFFPKPIRKDVLKLYGFVRIADDYVDSYPQNIKEFKILRGLWEDAIEQSDFDLEHRKNDSINERMVKNMVQLVRQYDIKPEWVDAFLESMQADIDHKRYLSLDGSLWYVYGSAEVIGLMMAKILGLPAVALPYAATQGRAMQWINFIRDIAEDNQLQRSYFPADDIKRFGLTDLSEHTARTNTEAFGQFIELQLARYEAWQTEANKGFVHIPKRLRIPLETAVEMYDWTAKHIAKQPLIIYEKKVRPKRTKIVRSGLRKFL